MVTLDVGDVPEDVYEALARSAKERGQSLQDFLLALVRSRAAELHDEAAAPHDSTVTAR